MLPDASKRAMCLELLEEFGATIKSINDTKGEITHGCLVSPGMHSDQRANPTASLNFQKLVYKCLGCGASGGLLWFIATCRGGSSTEARTWLEQTAGLGTSVMELEQMLRFLDNMYASRTKQPIPTYSDRALTPWDFLHPYFTDPYDKGGREIPEATAKEFRLGWDQRSDRVVLPHFWQGKLVGWQTRKMPPEWRSMPWEADSPEIHSGRANSPKYHSSPDFPKDTTIYNHKPRSTTGVVVVESMMSVLRHEHALHLEATFGASVTESQVKRLTAHEQVTLWMDNDKAGWRAVTGVPEVRKTRTSPGQEAIPGLGELLAPYGVVRVVDSPWSQDAGDLPTEEVLRLTACAPLWSLWKPPTVLYCFYCRKGAHKGACA
jgi:hypothetical protein